MCAVSAVSDYYTRQYPDRFGYNPFHPGLGGGVSGMPQSSAFPVVDNETKEMMRKVLQLLDKIDKKLGDVECMDEEKVAFLKALDLNPADLGG
jgi:hypothetical protein